MANSIKIGNIVIVAVVVQSLSHVQLVVTPWTAACQASLSFTIMLSLLKHVHWVSHAIQPFHPLWSLLLPWIVPSIRVFSNESALKIRGPKYWTFDFSTSPSNEYSGLISFRIDWSDLFAVQGTLKSPFQHRNLKAPVLWHSAFFIVQFSHSLMTTGKTRALTRQTFVSKVTSLLFNTLFCYSFSSKEQVS